MIGGKFWAVAMARLNKIANFFYERDPIAQMQYEYDLAVEQIKEGRKGLELYRGLVERVSRQVQEGEKHLEKLRAQAKAYLKAGDRDTAAKFALELKKTESALLQNREQLAMHETAYQNNLKKIQHANKSLVDVRQKIQRYDAELKMSEAEAEVAKLAESFDMNVTTDFGELESIIQSKIDTNRGKARVATDLSSRGIVEIEAEEKMEKALAEDALRELEVDMGLVAPETAKESESEKDLGPAVVTNKG
jgi:phage shock protein A